MRIIFTCLLVFLACQLIIAQQLLQQSFIGPVTGDTVLFNISLPAGYDASTENYPVVYHLHGIGGNQGGNQNVSVPEVYAQARQLGLLDGQYIVVFPNGLNNSMWADSKDGQKPVETHVIQELIPFVDSHFKTLPDRTNRYIQGFSMGGFGAAKFISKYPEYFQSAVIFDGALHNWQTFTNAHPDIALEFFDNDEAYFNEYAPWKYFRENAGSLGDSVCLRLSVGALTQYNRTFRDSLLQWGIPFEYFETSCQHNLGCLLNQEGLKNAVFQETCRESTSATEQASAQFNWRFYPNPCQMTLQIELSPDMPVVEQFLLFDLSGKLILTTSVNAPIQLDFLAPGLYLGSIKTQNGVYFQKLLKV